MEKVYLIGRSGVHANESFEVEKELIIGRDSRVCQLVYPGTEKKISGVHCKLQNINGNVCLIDLNSTNGTFFEDGTKLEPNMPRTVENGHGFYLGSRENSFDIRVETVQEPQKKERNFHVNEEQRQEQGQEQRQYQPAQDSVPAVSYVKKRMNSNTMAAIILLIILLIGTFFVVFFYQKAQEQERIMQEQERIIQEQQQELEEDEDKNTIEKIIDDGGDLIDDIFN